MAHPEAAAAEDDDDFWYNPYIFISVQYYMDMHVLRYTIFARCFILP
jgi:hypothetical protein